MSQFATAPPRVTIVMIARERHALTEATIECLVANTPKPYRLIYTDGQTPECLWQRLAVRSSEWNLELVRHDEPLWPQELRNRVLDSVTTDYVVFIDNDVQVAPGWLEKLVNCADETNAGIVGPLYMWGNGQSKPKIHMSSGSLEHTATPQGTVMTESHDLVDAYPEDVAAQLVRKPCDFVEFHCMMLSSEVLKKMGGLDASILNVHEHIDTALSVKQQGYAIYTEPAAQVNYLAYAPYVLDDVPIHRWRWAETPTETSIRNFCQKWQILDEPLGFEGVRNLAKKLVMDVDPLRLSAINQTSLKVAMRREELIQTRSELLDQAVTCGYSAHEIKQLSDAYRLAQALMDGGYRPCGRPFVNHLIGTASVLIRYGFKIEIVLAGMLHTLYSHGHPHPNGAQAAIEAVAIMLGGNGSPVEARVRAFTQRGEDCKSMLTKPASDLTVFEAELIAIAIANQIDMRLSGEIRYSGRDDALPEAFDAMAEHVCLVLGVNGLAQTFMECKNLPAVALELQTKIPVSYRLQADKKHAVPMKNNLLADSSSVILA
jgi:glycosyltransferase involved in cell wall biosynthesis